MIIQAEAMQFAREWIEAWNARDLERVLSHYTEDFTMSSPLIVTLFGEPSGTLKGRQQVGAYWKMALERLPALRFELLEVFAGVSSLVILYNAGQDRRATEVLLLNETGQVFKAMAHYDAP